MTSEDGGVRQALRPVCEVCEIVHVMCVFL